MPASSSTSKRSSLLLLPLELRDEILFNLLLPEHVYTSSPTPNTHTLHRSNRPPPTYVDTRIYLPARLPTNILQTCRQLREECMDFHSRLLNSLLPTRLVDARPPEDTSSNRLAARNNTNNDEQMERSHDTDTARITIEILKGVRGTMGFYVPTRQDPSPRFLGLNPLLSRLKKIKFTVWAGYDFWSGNSSRPIAKTGRTVRARLKRMIPDQDDQVLQPSQWDDDDATVNPPRPNPLTTAIDTLLRHLPLVDEIHIDILLHVLDFCNWDLPEAKWQGIGGWLDSSICSLEERKPKKVFRKLVVVHPGPPTRSATILRQRELLQEGTNNVSVSRGTRQIDPDWDGEAVPEEPSFTEEYQRAD